MTSVQVPWEVPLRRLLARMAGGVNLMVYDGVVFEQTFGDFGSFEEVQITTAAKGAEAMNPGPTYNFVIKSGSNNFHGSFLAAWQDVKFQSNNVNQKQDQCGATTKGWKVRSSAKVVSTNCDWYRLLLAGLQNV